MMDSPDKLPYPQFRGGMKVYNTWRDKDHVHVGLCGKPRSRVISLPIQELGDCDRL